jgi:hypothetical protein
VPRRRGLRTFPAVDPAMGGRALRRERPVGPRLVAAIGAAMPLVGATWHELELAAGTGPRREGSGSPRGVVGGPVVWSTGEPAALVLHRRGARLAELPARPSAALLGQLPAAVLAIGYREHADFSRAGLSAGAGRLDPPSFLGSASRGSDRPEMQGVTRRMTGQASTAEQWWLMNRCGWPFTAPYIGRVFLASATT